MQYTNLHKKFIMRTICAYLLAAASGGFAAAIALLFVAQYSNSYAQYIGLTVVTLLFTFIPFIIMPLHLALKQYAWSSSITDHYLELMSKSAVIYVLPAILSTVVAVASVQPDQPGFYFYSTPIVIATINIVLSSITRKVQLHYLQKNIINK